MRQIAALQGNVMQKTQAIMIVMTALTFNRGGFAVANLMTAVTAERRSEIVLRKAIGATNSEGYAIYSRRKPRLSAYWRCGGSRPGTWWLKVLGAWCLVRVLLCVRWCLCWWQCLGIDQQASVPALRWTLNMKPAEVLHGR